MVPIRLRWLPVIGILLMAAVYNWASGVRLPVTTAAPSPEPDRLQIGTFTVP